MAKDIDDEINTIKNDVVEIDKKFNTLLYWKKLHEEKHEHLETTIKKNKESTDEAIVKLYTKYEEGTTRLEKASREGDEKLNDKIDIKFEKLFEILEKKQDKGRAWSEKKMLYVMLMVLGGLFIIFGSALITADKTTVGELNNAVETIKGGTQ